MGFLGRAFAPLVFGKLKGTSAAHGISKGCMQGKSSICKDAESSPTGKEKEKSNDKNDDKNNNNKDKTTSADKDDHCKRAGGGGACTTATTTDNNIVHTSTITSWHPSTTTITQICHATNWGQACYHYYSAAENYKWIDNKFTCTDDWLGDRKKKNGIAATRHWYAKHKNTDWRSYWTTASYEFLPKGASKMETRSMSCQADEWPAAYMLPKKNKQDIRSGSGQIIRWLPAAQNEGAGSMWRGFCENNDGGRGNGRDKTDKDGKFLNWKRNEKPVGPVKTTSDKAGGKTTHITPYEATYSRAVFTMDYNWNGALTPSVKNNWGLEDNPCWPADIIPDDPGYVLLTSDVWYDTHPKATSYTASYISSPASSLVQSAVQRRNQNQNIKGKATGKTTSKKAGGAGAKRRDIGDDDERDLRVLKGGFSYNNGTISRRMTQEEGVDEIAIIDCEDATCQKELDELNDDENQGDFIVIPGENVSQVPASNSDVQPTHIVSTLLTMAKPQTGAEMNQEMPAPTS